MREIINKSTFEGILVEYYEQFFYGDQKNKRVTEWMDYINQYVALDKKKIIDIGCGTGIFEDVLQLKGDKVMAVDISKDMVEYAKKHHSFDNVEYKVQDMCRDNSLDKYDVAVSMSHVIGYQLENKRLNGFLKNVNKSIRTYGFFAFNFYHAPAVWGTKLSPRFVECKCEHAHISRVSNAVLNAMDNTVNLQYRYIIEESAKEPVTVSVNEKMRCFTVLEIENYLHYNGFEFVNVNKFLKNESLDEDEWNGFIVARKVKDIV